MTCASCRNHGYCSCIDGNRHWFVRSLEQDQELLEERMQERDLVHRMLEEEDEEAEFWAHHCALVSGGYYRELDDDELEVFRNSEEAWRQRIRDAQDQNNEP